MVAVKSNRYFMKNTNVAIHFPLASFYRNVIYEGSECLNKEKTHSEAWRNKKTATKIITTTKTLSRILPISFFFRF